MRNDFKVHSVQLYTVIWLTCVCLRWTDKDKVILSYTTPTGKVNFIIHCCNQVLEYTEQQKNSEDFKLYVNNKETITLLTA